jgi:hypothetical protein
MVPMMGMSGGGSIRNFGITRGGLRLLYSFSSHLFTNAGVTGPSGPSLAQCRASYNTASWTQNSTFFNMTNNGVQLWTVPASGVYRIEAAGARGGDTSTRFGRGAIMRGDFNLIEGETIAILVGQQGGDTQAGGGGGGTFIARGSNMSSGTLLMAAGGGGGYGSSSGQNGIGGQVGTSGTNGTGANTAGGTNGNGGSASFNSGWGGAGAGWFSNGGDGGLYGGIAYAPRNGGTGGNTFQCSGIWGGFGGGGGGGCNGAGGGGGYSGGGTSGGGGGSFNSGTNQSNSGAAHSGHGYVLVTLVSQTGGGGGSLNAPIIIPGTRNNSSGPAFAPSLSEYNSSGRSAPSETNYNFSSGYHYFTLPAGTYNVLIRGAEGSGTQHGYGAIINATLVVNTQFRAVALVGTAGSGSYSGGGGSFLAITTGSDSYSGATALLVAGGGGGGYSNLGSQADAGDVNWNSTSRRSNNTDCSSFGGGVYDAGAGYSSGFHSVSIYSCTTGSGAAQAFLSGGLGGTQSACGSGASNQGGFGGGGGGCPAGGGGYYGGLAGGNSPNASGGGGGTSYRLTSGSIAYISSWSSGGVNGSSRSNNPGTAHGYLSITKI